MSIGERIVELRNEKDISQGALAQMLGVSRQAISKWESNITYPETDKLIRMSGLFHCSLDYLLKDTVETDRKNDEIGHSFRKQLRERKSEKTVCGMPLWHIGRNAKGFCTLLH